MQGIMPGISFFTSVESVERRKCRKQTNLSLLFSTLVNILCFRLCDAFIVSGSVEGKTLFSTLLHLYTFYTCMGLLLISLCTRLKCGKALYTFHSSASFLAKLSVRIGLKRLHLSTLCLHLHICHSCSTVYTVYTSTPCYKASSQADLGVDGKMSTPGHVSTLSLPGGVLWQ